MTSIRHFLTIMFFLTAFSLRTQTVSEVTAELVNGSVTVHYNLQSDTPSDCFLNYSVDGGRTFKPCFSVSGDLWAQTSGNKSIRWNHTADNIQQGSFFFKVEAQRIAQSPAQPPVVTPPATPEVTPEVTPPATPAVPPTPHFSNYTEEHADLNLEMVAVQGGTFTMGCTSEQGRSCYGDEKPAHQVAVSDFYIGKYEVTQAQWIAIMGNNPSHFKGDNLPVEKVSWNDVQEFIRKLNAQTGKQYRLPTEAEWEYAARGGDKSNGYKYSGNNKTDSVAWYYEKSDYKSHVVGTKLPNELGIYDMSGNVWEWCNDWYGKDYYSNSNSIQTNPKGPSSGSKRVTRGGGWKSEIAYRNFRVSCRYDNPPDNRKNDLGFRLACSSE